jgi:DNA-binding IclR family transcriptional regulator
VKRRTRWTGKPAEAVLVTLRTARGCLPVSELVEHTGLERPEVRSALAELATAGKVGRHLECERRGCGGFRLTEVWAARGA